MRNTNFLISIFIFFSFCCSNIHRQEEKLQKLFKDQREDFEKLISYLNNRYNANNKDPKLYELYFSNCKHSLYKNNDYRKCDSIVNTYLERLNLISAEMIDNSCLKIKKYDLILLNSFHNNIGTWYIQFTECPGNNQNFENNRIKQVLLEKNWSIYIEK